MEALLNQQENTDRGRNMDGGGAKKVGGNTSRGCGWRIPPLLLVCNLDTPHLSSTSSTYSSKYHTQSAQRRKTHKKLGVYLLAQDPASPSLSKPIQFPAQIGVICALGNPPRVTFEEKTANKYKNWNQFRLWNKSICIQILCPAWLYILTTKLNSCWVTRHVFLVKTSKRVNNFPSSDRMWSLTKCAHGAGSSCQQCLENNCEQGGLTTCQNTPQSLSLF